MNQHHIKLYNFDLDLESIKKDARRINTKVTREYKHIEENNLYSKDTSYNSTLTEQLSNAPLSSKLHDYYNVFTYPYSTIPPILATIVGVFKEQCRYPHQYCVHGWLNYQSKGESIPWHHHWQNLSGLEGCYIGTYYVNAESSITTYKFDNGYTESRQNINNTFTLYEDVGDIHMVDTWQHDEPRISISMDFVPIQYIQGMKYIPNTWMPVI